MKRIFFGLISKILPTNIVLAHCDIPCGIYDPHNAQIGAHTVLRMTQLLSQVKRDDKTTAEHDIARTTRVKEKHAVLVEEELGTLENDYFKEEHFSKFPKLKKLIEDAVRLSAKTRQTIDEDASLEMLEKVLKISEIFYKTKGSEPIRISSGYPTKNEIVSHK